MTTRVLMSPYSRPLRSSPPSPSVFVMLALWIIGKCKGRHNHARNAMLATYTLVVSALVKSITQWVDCSDDGTGKLTYDVAPGEACVRAGTGQMVLGSLFFCCVIPSLVLLWALGRKTKKVPCCCCCPCFDKPLLCRNMYTKEPFSYDASYAWATQKYTPSDQSFEVAFIGYKVVTVFTSSEYTYTSLQHHRPNSNPSLVC
eukprot:COSAG06_NODE_3860_length_4823_cov_4.086367_4_plen_201_part_00